MLGEGCKIAIIDMWSMLKTKTSSWAYPYKMTKMHLGYITSSTTEAINGSIKRTAPGPLASMEMADSSKVIMHHSKELQRKRDRWVPHFVQYTYTTFEGAYFSTNILC
jgi:hypothetical protein